MKTALSIRLRLPLLICGLILAVLSVYTALAYREVRRGAILNASDRLHNVSRQLTDLLGVSVAQLRNITKAAADDPATKAYIRAPDGQTEKALLTRLQKLADPASSRLGVELWDEVGHRIITTDDSLTPFEPTAAQELIRSLSGTQPVSVGRSRPRRA